MNELNNTFQFYKMSTVSITFLIDFTKKIPVITAKSKVKKKKKIAKLSKVVEQNKKKSVHLENTVTVFESVFPNEIVNLSILVDKPIQFLHIEYCLLPRFFYKIDIAFWGSIAKVFTKEENKAMKCIIQENHAWVAFTIRHKFTLEQNELLNLKSHTIPFLITTDRKYVSTSALREDKRNFYFYKNDIANRSLFAEAFDYDPNIRYKDAEIKDGVPVKNEVLSFLDAVPDSVHCSKLNYMMDKVKNKRQISCVNKDDPPAIVGLEKPPKKTKKAKGKKSKTKRIKSGSSKKKKKAEGKTNLLKVEISGETLFTDPYMSVINIKKCTEEIPHAFIIINVKNLMSKPQKENMNPIVVKLESLNCIPVETLQKNNFAALYASYKIGGETYETIKIPLIPHYDFEDHRIHFLKDDQFSNLCEEMRTGYFFIELYGVKLPSKTTADVIFGELKEHKKISKFMKKKSDIIYYSNENPEKTNDLVLLAVACYRLDFLLNPLCQFLKTEYCIHPSRCPLLHKNMETNIENITINTINITIPEKKHLNPLNENILLSYGTTFKVYVEVLKPIREIVENFYKNNENYYNRIVLIIFENLLAKSILNTVVSHNSDILNKDMVFTNYLMKDETPITQNLNDQNLITGFTVDSGNFFLMFFEANSKIVHQLIFGPIAEEMIEVITIYYNSSHFFKDRIYKNLIKFGGVYNISLQKHFSLFATTPDTMTSGNVPEPCKSAIVKLDLILKSKTIKDITPNILPTAIELMSLDFEFGVPVHWPINKEIKSMEEKQE